MTTFVSANMRDAFDNIQSFPTYIDNSEIETNAESPEVSISLFDEIVKKFAESFSKDNKSEEETEQEAKAIVDAVDSDKNGQISLDELKSFDYSSVPSELGGKIKDLLQGFKIYDKNSDGGLDLAEIKNAIGKKQYSLQELRAMANKDTEDNKITLGGLSDSFVQNVLKTYKNTEQNLGTEALNS